LILVARMTPALSYLIPWFLLFQELGLANTYQALILTHLIIGLPLVIWVMIGFFEGVRWSWRMRLDRRLLPLRQLLAGGGPADTTGIVVSGILAFIFSWNNFIFAVVLAGPRLQTLPVAVFSMMSFEQTNWDRWPPPPS